MANVISIGCGCYPAITMRNMGILKESLPFDSVGSNLLGVLRILKKEATIDEFLKLREDNSGKNHMDFWLGHFIPNFTYNGILSKPHFKDGEDIRSTFIRRFARLLDFFYSRENTLIYTNLTLTTEEAHKNAIHLKEILDLNVNNNLLVINKPGIDLGFKSDRLRNCEVEGEFLPSPGGEVGKIITPVIKNILLENQDFVKN